MATFSPYALKPWFTKRLSVFILWAVKHNISPDVFTAVGVIGALIGGTVLALPGFGVHLPWWLIGALVLFFGLIVRLAGANLDGAVARARGVSRPAGFILNELGDRASDFLLFFGLFLGVTEPWKSTVVAVAFISSLPTLVAVSGAAVGATRLNGGPFGKTERCIAFVLLAVLFAQSPNESNSILIAVVLFLMGFGALATVLMRFRIIIRLLHRDGTSWRDDQPTLVKPETPSQEP